MAVLLEGVPACHNLFHQMKKERPDAELIQAPNAEGNCGCNQCPYMKLNTLEKIRDALKTLEPKIEIEESLMTKAHTSLNRMMKISAGESVTLPVIIKADASMAGKIE